MNLYGYVGGDPVNATDPSGLAATTGTGGVDCSGVGEDTGFQCDISVGGGGGGGGWTTICNGNCGSLYTPWPERPTGPEQDSVGTRPPIEPKSQKEEVRSKPLVCRALSKFNYDVKKTWRIANTARKSKTDGRTNWNNLYLREPENWLTAASDYYALPFARTPQIYLHQYRKTLPFSGSTPFSQEALDAGLDGQAHNGDTPKQLKAWCNGK